MRRIGAREVGNNRYLTRCVKEHHRRFRAQELFDPLDANVAGRRASALARTHHSHTERDLLAPVATQLPT